MFRWPYHAEVDGAVRRWGRELAREHPEVGRMGYLGSYARGDWGVGSDVDILIVVSHAPEDPFRRAAEYDATSLPVPADLIVYTAEEWRRLEEQDARFYRVATEEAVWVYP